MGGADSAASSALGSIGLTGRLRQSDRSGWLISCLDLPNFALRDHRPVPVEVLIPHLLCFLLLLFLIAKALQLPLLCMSQTRRAPLRPMILVCCALTAAGLTIIGHDWFL